MRDQDTDTRQEESESEGGVVSKVKDLLNLN